MGDCYAEGDGVPKDLEKAAYWFRKAAKQGLKEAQYALGACYANGEGVRENLRQAAYWFRKAAAQGSKEAKEALKELGY